MVPHDFILAAFDLVNSNAGKPRQANLRRATSTAYYALFHMTAKCCADLLVGGTNAVRSRPAWHQVYRALEHGIAKAACSNTSTMSKFPQQIQDYANVFVQMQKKRHDADYNPQTTLTKSEVLADIAAVKAAMDDFSQADLKDRRAFAAWVIFRPPRS